MFEAAKPLINSVMQWWPVQKRSVRDVIFIAIGAFLSPFLAAGFIYACCLGRKYCRKDSSNLKNEEE